ncbi:MFS transporter [Nocardia salmonicida]|uniref:MFS transporter n=1 Tax=Nocardia salmonicida TaxID=53431 RepID=UPI002E2B0A61|nr:MFS transporter [Nocardia salmonicida]
MLDNPIRARTTAVRPWAVLAVCSLSLFVVGLDATIVTVALPAIGDGIGVGPQGLEWVVDSYTLALASFLITSGAIADRVGRRRVFRLGLAVFGIASAVCALAPTVEVLIAARIAQGVGGSMLSPVALAIVVSTIIDPRQRARAIGVWAAVFGVSMAVGPTLGGALVDWFGWRSVFWIAVPVVVIALVLSAVFVPESRAEQGRRIDVVGQVLLVLVIAGVIALLIEGPRIGWGSATAVAGYLGVGAATAGFVWVERRVAEPLIDPALFRRAPFSAAVVGAVVVFVALTTTLLLSTWHLQQGRGMSAVAAGAITLPLAVAATFCAPLSGILVGRVGARLPLLLAGGFLTAGGALLVGAGDEPDPIVMLGAFALIGVGFGFANAPITNTAVSGLPAARAGVAGGITSTARQVGAAVGIAVAGGLIAGAGSARLGWIVVAGCGVTVVALARLSPSKEL